MSTAEVVVEQAGTHRSRSVLVASVVALAFALLSFGHVSGALALPPGGGGASGTGCPIGPEGSTQTAPPGTIYVFDANLTVICGSDGHWHRVVRAVSASGSKTVVTSATVARVPLASAK